MARKKMVKNLNGEMIFFLYVAASLTDSSNGTGLERFAAH
jgi:hypothetical protein